MRHLHQTRDMNCSQACVAMLAGKTVAQVERDLGKVSGLRSSETKEALARYGIKVKSNRFKQITFFCPSRNALRTDYAAIPKRALVRIKWIERKKSCTNMYFHLAIRWDGKWLDPGRGCEKGKCLLDYASRRHRACATSYLELA